MERKRLPRGKRKELLKECGDLIRPLNKKQIEWIRKDTAKYIWFDNKDAIHGHCDRCERDVEFKTKTKHNDKVKCPRCRQEMKIRHSWRVKYTEEVDFRVIVKVIDKAKILYRYVLVEQIGRDRTYGEVARELVDYEYKKRFQYEYDSKNGWVEGRSQRWFQEYNMYQYRKYCCLQADLYTPGLKAELKKLDALKYIEDATPYVTNKHFYVCSSIVELIRHADIYEKLEKAGHKEFGIKEFHSWLGYWGSRDSYNLYDETQSSLVKMMKLNNGNYKRWQKFETKEALKYLQKYPSIKDETFDYVMNNHISIDDYCTLNELKIGHEIKAMRYIEKNELAFGEYAHYVRLLKECGYTLDKAYLFPKDFRKEDLRISEEYKKRRKELEQKKKAKQNELIKGISDGLRNMDGLKEFLDGSKGLLVYVPESAEELENEGKALHNCIGTYVERVAEGKTLVFFVRKLESPNAPFVAFEYCNGEVIQCRYDHNKAVDDDKIINFVDALAERLRKNNVLYKAA